MNTSTNLNRSDTADRTGHVPGRARTIAGALFARWPTIVGLVTLAANSAGGVNAHVTAMMVGPVLAAPLAALAAIGHGVWDVVHHRRDKVVTRSLTEFCVVLDFGLGALLLIVTWASSLGRHEKCAIA